VAAGVLILLSCAPPNGGSDWRARSSGHGLLRRKERKVRNNKICIECRIKAVEVFRGRYKGYAVLLVEEELRLDKGFFSLFSGRGANHDKT
jgi:hypothetical protein